MSASGGGGGGGGGGGVGGALSLMGCVREASPPPQDPGNQGELSIQQNSIDTQPKEPKRRRFHPLRGLRKIFRRKSRGAADLNATSGNADMNDHHHHIISRHDREEVTLRHPAGRPEESRSRSASELLTDSCDRESIANDNIECPKEYSDDISLNPYEPNETVFLRRSGVEEAFAKLRGVPGQLSVSHDSVFPGEVPHTRPLSSLDPLATLERRPSKISENENKETSSLVTQRHRLSLQVLEQIKTVIESRNQVSSTDSSTILQNRSSSKKVYHVDETQSQTATTTTTRSSSVVQTRSHPKEDLPQLERNSLSHTAAMHRINVRPRNRRPPKRISSQMGPSSNITTISEGSDTMDSLEMAESLFDSPVESRNVTIIRKTSSRMTKTSDIFEELEAKLSSPIAISKSPDSLDSSMLSRTSNSLEVDEEHQSPITEIKPVMRKLSNRISKGSDIFAELSSKLPRRRSSINRLSKSPDSLENSWSKSTDSFDRLDGTKETKPVLRKSLNPVSKSTDRVSKSSDSLENLNTVNSDDSIERRRSSYEFRTVQRTSRAMSKSSENFEILEEIKNNETSVNLSNDDEEMQKGSSASDMMHLAFDNSRNSRVISKSSESIDEMEMSQGNKSPPKRSSSDLSKGCWRQTKRITVSSESSDNLELDDELENRRMRKPAKRIPSTSIVDIISVDNSVSNLSPESDKKPPFNRKTSRFQKSSESSELGSTDTVDSDRKIKSASTETLDSLEKDLELQQEAKEEEIVDNATERREKNNTWSGQMTESTTPDMEDTKPIISDRSYWRQSSDAKENIDIHQLLAITIVTHMADNGNQRNSVLYPKKKLSSSSPPTSPAKQEDNKMIFNNLLSNKNDEDLQNMLNGNISEVSTDTKSFKEKLIMFEKLGK